MNMMKRILNSLLELSEKQLEQHLSKAGGGRD